MVGSTMICSTEDTHLNCRPFIRMMSLMIMVIVQRLIGVASSSVSEFARKNYGSDTGHILSYDTIQCLSCMSADMERSWRTLQDIYFRPYNFTDDCNHPVRTDRLRSVTCTSMCVTIVEIVYSSGLPSGQHFIRGCLNQLARQGFNNSTVKMYGFDIYDLCDKVPRSQLFRNKLFAIDDHVVVCTCWGQKCNGDRPTNNRPKTNGRQMALVSLVLLLVLLLLRWADF